MSVIVKGIFGKEMPMPQEGYVDIRLHFKGGRIECATMPTGNPPYYATFKVVELPPHGRLIDADAIQDYNVGTFGQRLLIIDTAPTVIEAEGETK